MVAMVAPCLLWRIASTRACFESVRRVLFDGSFLRDMVGIPFWVEAACAATTEAPHKRWSRRGGIPGEPGAPAVGPVTLCSQKKSSRQFFRPLGAWVRAGGGIV